MGDSRSFKINTDIGSRNIGAEAESKVVLPAPIMCIAVT
jgi:hypothetical protein